MTLLHKTDSQTFSTPRKALVMTGFAVFAALSLSACGGDKAAKTINTPVDGRTAFENANDHALGSIAAPITLVEYASVTCPHCASWSLSVFPKLKEKYIDSGKVRYVFREFPTPPVDLANAGHLLANCAPEDKFFDLLHVQFKRQTEIRTSSDIKGEFLKLASSAGMNAADFEACMTNQAEVDRLQSVIIEGENNGVTGTPTFFINGKKAPARTFLLEHFDELFAPILGDDAPISEEALKDAAKEMTDTDDHGDTPTDDKH